MQERHPNRRINASIDRRLCTTFAGLPMRSPIIVGSGPPSATLTNVVRAYKAGAGAIILKSIGAYIDGDLRPHDRRRYRWIKRYGTALTSTFRKEIINLHRGIDLIKAAREATNFPIIASIFHPSMAREEDVLIWKDLAKAVVAAGAHGVQLDFFYLNLRKLDQTQISFLTESIADIAGTISVPLFLKLNIFMDDDLIHSFCRSDKVAGYIFNDSISVEPFIDIDAGSALYDGILYAPTDGRSASVVTGEPLLPFTFSTTLRLHKLTRRPLSAGGGLERGADVIHCLLGGASTVHITSAVMKHGVALIPRLHKQILSYLDEKNYDSVNELFAAAVQDQKECRLNERPLSQVRAHLIPELCIECGVCERLGVCDSFDVRPWTFEKDCDGCGYCFNLCPTDALVPVPSNIDLKHVI